MILREYRESDAEEILKWIKTERELRLWSWERYKTYPVTPKDVNDNYKECKENGEFYPMVLVDNEKIVGHLILRYPTEDKTLVRIGFIIVSSEIRGKGYGKSIINEAMKYARAKLGARKFNLGVFSPNENAIHCYKSVGFKEVRVDKNVYQFNDEIWDCIEMELE